MFANTRQTHIRTFSGVVLLARIESPVLNDMNLNSCGPYLCRKNRTIPPEHQYVTVNRGFRDCPAPYYTGALLQLLQKGYRHHPPQYLLVKEQRALVDSDRVAFLVFILYGIISEQLLFCKRQIIDLLTNHKRRKNQQQLFAPTNLIQFINITST